MWWRDSLSGLEKEMLDNLDESLPGVEERTVVYLRCKLVHLTHWFEEYEKRIDSAERQITNIEKEAASVRKEIDRLERARVSREEANQPTGEATP